ncbi:MAG: CarD family transcriptional regulator [Lachnospiraceae bacterium]|nr:CarD family transcriptional regulator [Lachnospiraceae bacterium]
MEEKKPVFSKKQVIYAGGIGVCRVENIVNLKEKSGNTREYYVLKSVYDTLGNAYIPVEGHKAELRTLMEEGEARKILNEVRLGEKEVPTDEKVTGELAWVLGMKLSDLLSEMKGDE